MNVREKFLKRSFDLMLSMIGFLVSLPIVFIAWLVASVDTQSNGFYMQQRVGKDGVLFKIVKIKTMKPILGMDSSITTSGDERITRSGAFFRRSKIDELPQLWNVLMGQMSFVGPRPDVAGYADQLKGDDRVVLSIRPGITGPASLKYKGEEAILAQQGDPKRYNDDVIWPDKVKINREYIERYRLFQDFLYIWKTIIG